MTYLQTLAEQIAKIASDTDEVNIFTTEGWPAIVHVKSGLKLKIYVQDGLMENLTLVYTICT